MNEPPLRLVATVDRTATPSAPPICCDVLKRPDARPASCCVTPASAAIETGTNEKPSPIPIAKKPGRRSTAYEPSGETCVNQRLPSAIITSPKSSAGLTPIFVTTACATPAETTAVSATAR